MRLEYANINIGALPGLFSHAWVGQDTSWGNVERSLGVKKAPRIAPRGL